MIGAYIFLILVITCIVLLFKVLSPSPYHPGPHKTLRYRNYEDDEELVDPISPDMVGLKAIADGQGKPPI